MADFKQRIRLWYREQDDIAADRHRTRMELERIERGRKEREAKHAAIVAVVEVFKTGTWSAPSSIAEAFAPTQTADDVDVVISESEEQADVMMGEVEHDAAVQAKFKDSGIHVHSDDDAAVADTAGEVQDNIDIDVDLPSDINITTDTAAVIAQEEELVQAKTTSTTADNGAADSDLDEGFA